MTAPLYDIPVRRIDGTDASLAEHRGEVLLIVNVASACGLTPQYAGLERLYETYRDRGFAVLGFPANDFGAQEPGSNAEIKQFCETRFGVRFPMFEKIAVKGEGQHPLYRHLTAARPAAEARPDSTLRRRLDDNGLGPRQSGDVTWNFEKFLVDRRGEVVARFAPDVPPDDPMVVRAIERALEAPRAAAE